MSPEQRTSRVISEFATACLVRDTAKERGTHLTLEQAHAVWAEHSDDMAAQWLVVDSENPRAEIWRAITKWDARHTIKPRRRT